MSKSKNKQATAAPEAANAPAAAAMSSASAPAPAKSEAEESLELIAAAEVDVETAESAMLRAKELAKSKSKAWEAAVGHLRQVVRDRSTPLPLFAKPEAKPEPKPNGKAEAKPEPAPYADAWRAHPVATLDVDAAILGKLSEAGLATLGDLVRMLDERKPLVEIPGIDAPASEAILGALDRYRATLAEPAPQADGEALPADEPAPEPATAPKPRKRRKAEAVEEVFF